MSEFAISQIYPTDRRSLLQIDSLLKQEGIKRDSNLDYICAMYDEEHQIVATGSCFANTLRCLAVSSSHQGEGLLNQILTHLVDVQYRRVQKNQKNYSTPKSILQNFSGIQGFMRLQK